MDGIHLGLVSVENVAFTQRRDLLDGEGDVSG